jgi:hypothetical protein
VDVRGQPPSPPPSLKLRGVEKATASQGGQKVGGQRFGTANPSVGGSESRRRRAVNRESLRAVGSTEPEAESAAQGKRRCEQISGCAQQVAQFVLCIDGFDETCDGQTEVTRGQIEKAIERNFPFVLKMADGNEYRVPHRDYIVLPPRAAYVIVFDETDPHDAFDVLPLLTMTGLHQAGNGAQES